MTLHIPVTKTDSPRVIPLNRATLISAVYLSVVNVNIDGLTKYFKAGKEAAGIFDGDFHCLRHSLLTRTAKKGLTPQQIASVSGHKTLSMVARYTHLNGEDIRGLL